MSIKKFGQYLIEIEDPQLGSEFVLDGNDGFADQSLWNYRQGDIIKFMLNPNLAVELLKHSLLYCEVFEDTNKCDWAKVKIIGISGMDQYFHEKSDDGTNDFQELVIWMSDIWDKTHEQFNHYSNYKYHSFPLHFLTFRELGNVERCGEFEVQRWQGQNSRIYARRLKQNLLRVLSVDDNCPESCYVYDINDVDYYKSLIVKMMNKNNWIDEVDYWKQIVTN